MRYLLTSALPYANGPIHLGHIAGAYLPGDIYNRFLKNMNEETLFICGTDEHGVPITINAESRGITPEDVIKENHKKIENAFNLMEINFDIFSGTHNETHFEMSKDFFLTLQKNGYITQKVDKQFYCEHDKKFLPDRYVEGICPLCGATGARGDQCDKCGNSLNSIELKEPKCKICGATPVIKESKHWFLELNKFQDRLAKWLDTKTHWKNNVKQFCKQWFERGLEPRAITRDINWGVPVPAEGGDGKVLYVWFDAPIGYISFTKSLLEKRGEGKNAWEKWWKNKEDVKLVHFIGKDNIVFHSMVFPSMLMGQENNFKLPDEIPANEFLNLEGDKFSTSKNYAVWVDDILQDISSDILRFYLAKNAPENKDADFSFKGLQNANNGELAAIYGNFVNRNLSFINKFFKGKIPLEVEFPQEDKELWNSVEKEVENIKLAYSEFRVRDAVFHLMELGRISNKYFDTMAPWALRKENKAKCAGVLLNCLNLIDKLATLFEPITPTSSRKTKEMLNIKPVFDFSKLNENQIKEGHKIGTPEILYEKIEDELVEKWKQNLEATK